MTLTEATLRFIAEHRRDDVRVLALQAGKYPDVDMPTALTQIAGRQTAETKIPTWAATEGILYPPHLSMEQCSSEVTARYKASVVSGYDGPCHSLADLTGGFGIDFSFLAPHFGQATYVERQEVLCQATRHNFPLLGLSAARVIHTDGVNYLRQMPAVDWLYLDPARRNGHGGKTVAIADCEPDVTALETLLLEKAVHVLVKLSPMLDLWFPWQANAKSCCWYWNVAKPHRRTTYPSVASTSQLPTMPSPSPAMKNRRPPAAMPTLPAPTSTSPTPRC